MAQIRIENVRKEFGSFTAVQSSSFTIEDGEFFMLLGPNSGLGHNSMIFMIEAQVNYIMDAMRQLKARGADYLDVKPEVQRSFNAEVQENIKGSVWSTGCQSWYITAEPEPRRRPRSGAWCWRPSARSAAAAGAAPT